ncbi:MAG: hypothetical protein GC159_02455 [Phycisphaera sp.]|nr:hypothetical protein [Phycisphaera sp.]
MTDISTSNLEERIARLLYPLADFYSEAGQAMPNIEPINGADMPQPYRSLLVHDNDMTPTLEAYCRQNIHLKLIKVRRTGDALCRQVILVVNSVETPIEFGAIKIYLDRFETEPRGLILQGYRPLGRILADYKIPHYSRPTGYFRINSESVTQAAFGLGKGVVLYGRHNILWNSDDEPLAEVVEVLPPLEGVTFGSDAEK